MSWEALDLPRDGEFIEPSDGSKVISFIGGSVPAGAWASSRRFRYCLPLPGRTQTGGIFFDDIRLVNEADDAHVQSSRRSHPCRRTKADCSRRKAAELARGRAWCVPAWNNFKLGAIQRTLRKPGRSATSTRSSVPS